MLFSVEWWVTAGVAGLVAGIIGSVLAAYVVRWLDRGGGSAVRWIATRTNHRRAVRAARIKAARIDVGFMSALRMKAVTLRLEGLGALVAGAVFNTCGATLIILPLIRPDHPVNPISRIMAIVLLIVTGLLFARGGLLFLRARTVDDEILEAELTPDIRPDSN